MPTTFTEAYDKFSKSGIFELDNQLLYAQQIDQLRARAKFLKEDKPDIACCRFHLNRVKLIPGRLPKADPEQVVSGVIVEHPETRSLQDEFTDFSLVNMARSSNGSNVGLRFNETEERLGLFPESRLKEAFLDLLSQAGTWNSIKINPRCIPKYFNY